MAEKEKHSKMVTGEDVDRFLRDLSNARCPKCGNLMRCYERPSDWEVPSGLSHYFQSWYRCQSCHHKEYSDRAKVWLMGSG